MRITCEPITLDLRTTFRIAHGASDQRHNVLVHLGEGIGEAAAVAYHGETQAGMADVFGLGSHPLPGVPYFGAWQARGVEFGQAIIAIGLLMLIPYHKFKRNLHLPD